MVDNPLKREVKTTAVEKDKREGRHLGSGRIVSAFLADAEVDLYVYLEAERNFLRHLEREGINIYKAEEKVIETALKIIEVKAGELDQMQESGFTGLGRRRGLGRDLGRGLGRRAGRGRGLGNGAGMGQGIGRAGGMGRGLGNR